jgi:hypothetical protein
LAWQIGVWDRISQIYLREIDKRFEPVVEQLIARAALAPGQYVLDLGTGTGSVAIRAASLVGPSGQVSVNADISVSATQAHAAHLCSSNFTDVNEKTARFPLVGCEPWLYDECSARPDMTGHTGDRALEPLECHDPADRAE